MSWRPGQQTSTARQQRRRGRHRKRCRLSGLPRLIGDLHVAEQAVDLDLDLGTSAASNLDLPVPQQAEPALAHAASPRNPQHQITAHTHKGQRGPGPAPAAASNAASAAMAMAVSLVQLAGSVLCRSPRIATNIGVPPTMGIGNGSIGRPARRWIHPRCSGAGWADDPGKRSRQGRQPWTREPTQPARTNTMVTVAPARRMRWRRLHMRCSVCLPGAMPRGCYPVVTRQPISHSGRWPRGTGVTGSQATQPGGAAVRCPDEAEPERFVAATTRQPPSSRSRGSAPRHASLAGCARARGAGEVADEPLPAGGPGRPSAAPRPRRGRAETPGTSPARCSCPCPRDARRRRARPQGDGSAQRPAHRTPGVEVRPTPCPTGACPYHGGPCELRRFRNRH
jgi:hypothetical protein